jgi:hypothetical protein
VVCGTTCVGSEVATGASLWGTAMTGACCCRPASSCDGVASVERSSLAGISSKATVFPAMVFSEIDAVVSETSLSGAVLAGAGCCRLASSCDGVVSAERSGLAGTLSEAMVFPEVVFPEIEAVVSGAPSCSEALESRPTRVLLPLDVLRGEYGGTSLGVCGGGGPGGNLGRIGSGKVIVMRIAVVE